MEQHQEELRAAGLQPLAVGLGEAKHAERYCGRLAPSLTCFAAENNDRYYAWGLRHGKAGELLSNSLNILKASTKALAAGHIQGKTTGDPHMMPGTFIVDRDGIIRYAYYSQYAGDDPPIDVLVEAARQLNTKP